MMEKRRTEIENSVLYNSDCLQTLALIERGSIDAMIFDPPYCSGGLTESEMGGAKKQGLRSKRKDGTETVWFGGDNMTAAGLVWLMRSIAVEADRVVKASGSILAFCDWRMALMLAPAMESGGWRLRNLIVWNKGHFGMGVGFRPQHELIMHLTKRAPTFHHQGYGNVLDYPRVSSSKKQHPTEKPLGVMQALIEVTVPRGGIVLDPFMGSGSTGVAAIQMGRLFIGIEKEPDFFDIACQRIRNEHEQGQLFNALEESQAEQLSIEDKQTK